MRGEGNVEQCLDGRRGQEAVWCMCPCAKEAVRLSTGFLGVVDQSLHSHEMGTQHGNRQVWCWGLSKEGHRCVIWMRHPGISLAACAQLVLMLDAAVGTGFLCRQTSPLQYQLFLK